MSEGVRGGGDGLSDALSLDFVDPQRRIAALADADLEPLLGSEGVVSVSVPALGSRGDLELEARRLREVRIEGGAFADATGLVHEAFAVRVTGRWRPREGPTGDKVEGLGRLVRTSGEPDWDRIELIRLLSVAVEDGSLLAVASARPNGAAGHDEEATSAIMVDSDGSAIEFEQPLLSTEYDAAGRHRRAGIELWGANDAAPLRGAGTRIGGTDRVALMGFTLDGVPGTARYDLVRPS